MSRHVKEYFEKTSSEWDSLRKGLYGDEVRDSIIKAADIGPQDIVLEVGAGTGFLTESASKAARTVFALDISKPMIDEAVSKLIGHNVEFKVGSVEHIPLGESTVDIVIGNMFLHHCPNPENAIVEMVRVLRPGGRIAFADMQEHQFEWLRTEMADVWRGFRMENVGKMLRNAGLADVSVQALGCCCTTASSPDAAPIEVPLFLASAGRAG